MEEMILAGRYLKDDWVFVDISQLIFERPEIKKVKLAFDLVIWFLLFLFFLLFLLFFLLKFFDLLETDFSVLYLYVFGGGDELLEGFVVLEKLVHNPLKLL